MRPTSISSDSFCLISKHFWVCQFLLIYQCWRGCAQIACHLHGALHTSESHSRGPSKDHVIGQRRHHRLCWESPQKCSLELCCAGSSPGTVPLVAASHQPNHLTAYGKASSSHYTFLPAKTQQLQKKLSFPKLFYEKKIRCTRQVSGGTATEDKLHTGSLVSL